MAVKIIGGDLLSTDARYICHQVNCQGRMGSGVARMIREKFPGVYDRYKEECLERRNPLGTVLYVPSKGRVIVNMFAQDRYGYDGKTYTNYDAFMHCLVNIHDTVPQEETVAMPYKIGCGLGGGDWSIIYDMIERKLGADHSVELWRL